MEVLERKRATEVQPRDIRSWQHLNYHGPLSLPYLSALLGPEFPGTNVRNLAVRQHRLTYYGELHPDRPGKRLFNADLTKFLVYANSKAIDKYLYTNGFSTHPSISLQKNNFAHEVFNAHCSAAMEIGAPKYDWEFTKVFDNRFEIPCEISAWINEYDEKRENWGRRLAKSKVALVPDRIFRLEDEKSYITCLVEVDRGNEQVRTADLDKKAWKPTLLKYMQVIDNGELVRLGIKGNVRVLLFFNDKAKMDDVKKELDFLTKGQGRNYFCFYLWPEFLDAFYVPTEVNLGMYENGFERIGIDPKTKLAYQPFFLC